MNIYREFEEFIKRNGRLVEERRTAGGLKSVWEIGNRMVMIDEEPDEEDQRVVMVVLVEGDRELVEYLSPVSVLGGALEQLPVAVSPERISSPSQLELILRELKSGR